MRSHRFASVLLLALSSLAGAGCSDDVTSVPADDASVADQLNASVNNARRRMPYFTDVQVTPDTMYLGIGASYELTVQNPGPKTSGIFFNTDVEAPGEDPAQVDHFVARCPNADGKLGRGACTMTSNIVPSATRFRPGPAELVLRMFRSDGANLVMLDIRRLPIYLLAI